MLKYFYCLFNVTIALPWALCHPFQTRKRQIIAERESHQQRKSPKIKALVQQQLKWKKDNSVQKQRFKKKDFAFGL